jgi:apolipoprotein D and lipocalin family protein
MKTLMVKQCLPAKAASAAFLFSRCSALLVTAAALFGCASSGSSPASFAPRGAALPQTVATVDLNRYLGKWYEVARLPNRFQDLCKANVNATYSLNSDGSLKVENRCETDSGAQKEAIGQARVVDPSNAKLEVRFAPSWIAWLPMVWGDYWVLHLEPDYSAAVVGSPDRKFLWVLSRSQILPKAKLDWLLSKASDQGFASSLVVPTIQK